MKSVVDAYIGLWLIMVFLLLCIAFTSINLNVIQARKMYNDIKAQVQAANGDFVDKTTNVFEYDSTDATHVSNQSHPEDIRTVGHDGYQYKYRSTRQALSASDIIQADNETWIYNDIYKIEFRYRYGVPLFGLQEYPIVGYTY